MENTTEPKVIGVFGGSFNPPTISHYRIVQSLLHYMDEVWILPVFKPPHKNNLVAFHHRIAMLEAMFSEHNNVVVSDFEKQHSVAQFHQGKDSTNYTAHTLAALNLLYPQDRFVYAHGPDIVLSTYKDFELIQETFMVNNDYKERSSYFREALGDNHFERAKRCVTKNVWDYIIEHKIYDPKINVDSVVVHNGFIPHLDLSIRYNDNEHSYKNVEQFQQSYQRELIKPKDSIGITLFDLKNRKVLIKREKRFGPFLNERKLFQYGVVEGTMEQGEDPILCAQREVEEETGLSLATDDIQLVNYWYPSAGYMTEIKHVLVGFFNIEDYQNVGYKQGLDEENEEIYTEIFDFDELMMWHTMNNGPIFTPEISAALLFIYFQYNYHNQ